MNAPPKPRSTQASPRWAFWRWHDIPDATNPDVTYLRRLRIIHTPWFGVYLHWIYLPDQDRDHHDHPWPFVSAVLRGGYHEEIAYPPNTCYHRYYREHRRGSIHRMPRYIAHKITDLRPGTVTLVLVGRRSRDWGFWTSDGFVPYTQYHNADGTPKHGPDPFDS